MKKKITAAVLAVVMLVGILAGCTGNKDNKESSGESNQNISAGTIGKVDDLKGKKIGVQAGTTGEIYVEDIENAQPASFHNVTDLALELKNKKINAILLDEVPAKELAKGNSEFMILPEKLTEEDYAIAVRKGDTAMLEAANKTLARIKADGTYQKFVDAFIPADGVQKELPKRAASTAKDVLVIGTNASFPPFEYTVGTDIVGLDVEIMHEIANDMGKKLKIENMNFNALIASLQSGKVDMIMAGMTASDKRKKEVDFSDAYYTSTQVIIIRKDDYKAAQ